MSCPDLKDHVVTSKLITPINFREPVAVDQGRRLRN
jgi:hypothetical protein